jgi:hypothetical protein
VREYAKLGQVHPRLPNGVGSRLGPPGSHHNAGNRVEHGRTRDRAKVNGATFVGRWVILPTDKSRTWLILPVGDCYSCTWLILPVGDCYSCTWLILPVGDCYSCTWLILPVGDCYSCTWLILPVLACEPRCLRYKQGLRWRQL